MRGQSYFENLSPKEQGQSSMMAFEIGNQNVLSSRISHKSVEAKIWQ